MNQISSELFSVVDNYIVFDLETTGLSPIKNEIVQLSAVKVVAGKQVDTFNRYVKPSQRIPLIVTSINGIDNDMVESEQKIEEVLPEFLKFICDFILIAHNAKFDMSFLAAAMNKTSNKSLTNNYIDTLKWSRKILPNIGSHSLDSLINYYALEDADRHNGLGDCLITNELYKHLVKDCMKKDIRIGRKKIIKQSDADRATRVIAGIKPIKKGNTLTNRTRGMIKRKANRRKDKFIDKYIPPSHLTNSNHGKDNKEKCCKPINYIQCKNASNFGNIISFAKNNKIIIACLFYLIIYLLYNMITK